MTNKRVSFSSNDQYICAGEKPQGRCYLPARYVLTFFLFWGLCLKNAFKASLSVTIVEMVNQTAIGQTNSKDESDSCPIPQNALTTEVESQGNILWSPSIQGLVLAAYFYGYMITPIVGGRISEMFGGKWPFGLAILISSFLMFITPVATTNNASALVATRFVMGLLHGLCFPTAFAMLVQWAPSQDRTSYISICLIGDQLGTVVAMPLAGYLSKYGFSGGWPSVYYVFGGCGCFWSLFWFCLICSSPSDHPRISKKEIDYIQKDNNLMKDDQKLPIPWRTMLTSISVWSVALAFFCSQWGYTTLLTKLPTYLKLVLLIPIEQNGLVNSLVHVCTCVSLFVSGFASDYIRSKKHLSSTTVRKIFETIGLLGPALCLVLIPSMRCNSVIIIALLAAALGAQGFTAGGHTSIAADMAPHHAATLYGFVSGIGHFAGVFSPMVAGAFLEQNNSSIYQWSLIFYTSAAIYIVGIIIFLAFASAEIQPWAIIPELDKQKVTDHFNNSIRKNKLTANKCTKYGTIS